MRLSTAVIVGILLLASITLLGAKCRKVGETTAEHAKTDIVTETTMVDLGDVRFGGRTYRRFYDRGNRVLCYKIEGYSVLSCVYTGQGAGYAERD